MTLLLEATLKTSAIVGIALAAVLVLNRASAAQRHWVLAAAIVAAAMLPIVALGAPTWNVAGQRVGNSTSGAEVDVSFDLPPRPMDAPRAPAASPLHADPTAWLIAAWLLGAVLSLATLLSGILRLRVIARRAVRLSDERWTRLLEETAAELGVSTVVGLLEGREPAPPVTWGVRRPVVLVPRGARTWTEERIRHVLRHELAHVLRRDWGTQIVAAVVRSGYWFNPLVWIACARLREESERACDDVVLAAGVPPADYASHLVDLARTASHQRLAWVPAQAIVRPSNLQRRVAAMLHADTNRRPITRRGRVVPPIALLLVTFAVAGFGRAAQSGTVLSGTVADPMGRGTPGVTIALVDAQNASKHEVKTDAAGRYEFVPLPAGEYVLRAATPGFKTLDDKVTLSGGRMTHDVALLLGTVEESIRVSDVPTPPRPSTTTLESRRERARAARAADACAQSKAGGCVLPPTKLKDVKPEFPDALKGTEIKEPVVLQATIAIDGSVKDLKTIGSPHPDLTAAAMDAVNQWEFAPTQLNGVPIETTMRVTVRFETQR